MAISEELKQRIENFGMGRRSPAMDKLANPEISMAPFGSIDTSADVQAMRDLAGKTKGAISNKDLEILNQASSLTPEERAQLMQEIENARMREMAPLGQVSSQIEQMGTGDDQFLVHTEFGDTIVPPQIINDDPELEAMLQRKFEEYNITPEERVVGSGIATLNPQTGLPEYGFFKKLIKGIGKVVKKVAPVAAFIPGIGTALGGVLGGIGGKVVSGISKLAPGLGSTLGSIGSSVMSGIANLGVPGFSSIAGGTAGGFPGIKGALTTRSGLFGGGPLERIMGADPSSTAVRSLEAAREAALASGDTAQVAAIDAQLATYKAGTDLYNRPQIIGTDPATGAPIYAQPQQGGIGGLFGGQGGGFGGQGGGMGALGMAGLAGLAGTLGKMAYDETKKDMGVPMTPMTMLGPVGRFNIEAEIARRMGQEAPNPVEFGLLPQGTFPELSGGRPLESEMMPSMGVSQPPVMAPIDMVDPRPIPKRPPSIEQIQPPVIQRPPSIEYIPEVVDAPPVVQQPPMMPIDMPINIPQIAQLDIPMVMPDIPLGDITVPPPMPAVQPMPMPRRAVDSIRPRISRRRGRGVGALRRANGGAIMNYEGGGSANKYPNEGLEALARVAPDVVKRMGYAGGGPIYPMAYAEGGAVAMKGIKPETMDKVRGASVYPPEPGIYVGDDVDEIILSRQPIQYDYEKMKKYMDEARLFDVSPRSVLYQAYKNNDISEDEYFEFISRVDDLQRLEDERKDQREMESLYDAFSEKRYENPMLLGKGGEILPMAYAEGGNVSMEDFERMNGGINGAGTETSDDIPAMLSDGEFVMTGQAVRGAGSYEMAQDNRGIISLIPNMQEDRERGTRLMYDLMDAFDGKAGDLQ